MKVLPPRPLTDGECALVLRLLEFGGHAHVPYTALDRLRVHATCDCGCGSFEMESEESPDAAADHGKILADGYGTVQDGNAVGLILWGTDQHVSYCEIYALGFDPPYELPRPDSVSDVPAGFDPPA